MIAPFPKTVVVTGGSAGVGRAIVREFAAAGADVGIIARGEDRLKAAAADVRAMGRRACWVSVDVSDAAGVEEAAGEIEDELGPIDCWINNAMTAVFAPVMETSADEFRRVTEVTYLGVVHGTLAALRRMRPRGHGTIIQVSSALAFRGIPLQATYCASKHAIVGFTQSLRSELIHDGLDIHVGMVHLPGMNTPQFDWVLSRLSHRAQPVPPIFQPEVAARAVRYATEHRRREIVVGFPTFKTVWGGRLAPGFTDRRLAKKGYAGQQTPEPLPENRPSNLWEPAPNDVAAHGRFDARAKGWSAWARMSEHWLVFGGGAAALAALLAMTLVALATLGIIALSA